MKRAIKLILLLTSAFLLLSCASATRQDPSFNYEDLLRSRLTEGLSAPQVHSVPFKREFSPYLEGKWIGQGVSYGCYREGQAPGVKGPSKEEILQDLRIIAEHWNLIRVYNADDDTERILEVIHEHKLPIKVMLGIWLENETDKPAARASNVENVLRGIRLTNTYEYIVIAVNVGNETQVFWSWHKMASADLIRYIRTLKSHTKVPITTADDYNFWNKAESRDMALEVDFIVVHAYPLWNGKNLSEAIPWLDATLDEVQKVHPDKLLVLGEIGWATDYNASKKGDGEQGTLVKGEVGLEAQERFLQLLDAWVKTRQISTFLFEAFDEPWKGGGASTGTNEIEKNWGVFYESRLPKQSFINYLAAKEPR